MSVALPVHALHDGYSDVVYVMLPIWQAEFALSYAAVGLLRSTLSGTMAAFQIPAGLLAEWVGGGAGAGARRPPPGPGLFPLPPGPARSVLFPPPLVPP